jgi:hypothetical protein
MWCVAETTAVTAMEEAFTIARVMAESTYVRADGEREDRTIRAAGLQEVNLKKN